MKNLINIILITLGIGLILLVRACYNGGLYEAGTGVGDVGEIKNTKYKSEYLRKYSDSFFAKYPKYKLPKDEQGSNIASNYAFLKMTAFYFDTLPKEVYHVDWGTMSVRFGYNIDKQREIYSNPRGNVSIPQTERERISKRIKTEVIERIEKLIDVSKDRDSAILKL